MANTSIFPDPATAGGIVIRDGAGNPTNPPNVEKAYSPLPAFISTCLLTALPADCTARIEPKQINAIVSEIVSFAEYLDPNGPWNCDTPHNLRTMFEVWSLANVQGVYVSDDPPIGVQPNKLWYESDTGNLYLHYQDADSLQWVQVNGVYVVVDGVSIVGSGLASDPFTVNIIDCGEVV